MVHGRLLSESQKHVKKNSNLFMRLILNMYRRNLPARKLRWRTGKCVRPGVINVVGRPSSVFAGFQARAGVIIVWLNVGNMAIYGEKIRLKKTDEDKFYVVKTLRQIDEEGAKRIVAMKEEVRQKRQEKRHRGGSP